MRSGFAVGGYLISGRPDRFLAYGGLSPSRLTQMIRTLLAKLGQIVVVVLAAGLVSFTLFEFVPDPTDAILGENASIEDRGLLRQKLGNDKVLWQKFPAFVARCVQGDFGKSMRSNEDVGALLRARFPATIELVLVSSVLTISLGIVLGVFAGTHRERWLSSVVMNASLVGVSVPPFLLGLLAIFLFSVHLGWLPASGRFGLVDLFGWRTSLLSVDGWRSILLPALTLSAFNIALFVRLVRTEVIEIRSRTYIKFARARGIGERAISRRHVLPNALAPLISVAALNIGTMIAFSVITETVFQWPGLGLMFIQAIGFSDFPVMSAYFLVVAVMFVCLNFGADILVALLDPRARAGRHT